MTDEQIIALRKECFGGRFGTPSVEPWSDTIKFARALLAAAAPSVAAPGVVWPKQDRVGRKEDMSATGKLEVMMQKDGDVIVHVCKGDNAEDWESASVEFCAGGGGGGRSHNTRMALIALMVAIEADNAASPHVAAPSAVPGDARPVDAPLSQCTFCGRKSWDEAERGFHCNMPQPDGLRCLGTMVAARQAGQQQGESNG